MLDLDQVVKERHSTRMFLPKPVPQALVDEAVALAQLAPSNSNIQPWHLVFVSGPPRDRLVAAMLEEAKRRPPNIPPLPESFRKRGLQGVLINAADYAAGRDFCPASSAARFHGSSSSMRLTGWSAIRESTSRR